MKHSDAIDALAAALAAAQGECKPVAFDRDNPFFHSRYATLAALWAEIRPVFARHGLSIIQGADERGAIETTILHASGQWITAAGLPMRPVKDDPQGIGSLITYARRYGLAAAAGLVADEDDDGNASTHGKAPQSPQDASKPPQASTHHNDEKPVNAEGSHVNAGDRADKGAAVLEGRISTDPYVTTIQVKGSPCEVARFDLIVDNETLSVTAWHDARDEAMQYHAGDEVEVTGTWNHYRDRWNVNAAAVRDRLPF